MAATCPTSARLKKSEKGFTLVELLVVITILAILFTIGIGLFNPAVQLGKAKNSQRQHNLTQIQAALDTYFNDTGCYPTTITFGSQWKVGKVVYMQRIPQDPDCASSNTSSCYRYETDTTATCPQWNVLYAQLQAPLPQSAVCPLTTIPNCKPNGYNANTDGNYCVLSGKIDCPYIVDVPVPTVAFPGGGGGGGGGNGGGSSSPTATPTPSYICQGSYFACTGNPSKCNVESPQGNCLGHNGSYQCYCTYSDCLTFSGCTQ